MNLGHAIKNFRKQKGVKQNLLAQECGITQTYLSQIENNIKEPNLSTLRTICNTLEVPMPILFFLSIDINDVPASKRNAFNHLQPSINSMILEFFGESIELE